MTTNNLIDDLTIMESQIWVNYKGKYFIIEEDASKTHFHLKGEKKIVVAYKELLSGKPYIMEKDRFLGLKRIKDITGNSESRLVPRFKLFN
jgi:hypothetical protein